MGDKISLKRYDEKEYIIRDEMEIIIGRFILAEEDKSNNYISFRFYFYREGENLVSISLSKLIDMYRLPGFYKLSIYSESPYKSYSDLGFILEGVISGRIKDGSSYKSLYIYGVNLKGEKSIRSGVPILSGERLKLKLLTPEDSEELLNYHIRNRDYLRPFDPLRKEEFFTIETQTKDIEKSFNDYLKKKAYNFGIFKDEKFIGKLRISSIVYGAFHNAFIGYSIDKEEQRKGYMKEAVKLVTDFCFNELDIHRIEASTLIDNTASQKVLLASGFNKIGLSSKYLFINGKWRDHYTFYKLKEN
ncbi:MAG: GNAT family protein [Clostridiaceae bacterium]